MRINKLKLVMFAILLFGISELDSQIAAAQKSGSATIILDNNQNQVAQAAKADVLLSPNQEAPVQVAVEDGISFGVWYPYESNTGVPPISSFTARGINITFIQGDLDAGEIAKYDVIFIGRAGAIGQFPSGAGTLDIDALISFVNNGGGLIAESNATIFDSDYWRSVPWSSRLSVLQGISGDQDGYDYAECDFSVSINNSTHPIAHGVASSFILNGCYANKNSASLDTSKNQAAVLVGTANQASIVATDFGKGCSVYFPSAVGFGGGMDWSANPDYETLFLNAVEYAGTCGKISCHDTALAKLQEAMATVNALPAAAFKTSNMQHGFVNQINTAILRVKRGKYAEALHLVRGGILVKTDGCAVTGGMDKNDWLKDCADQATVYSLLMEAIECLESMM